MVWDSKARAPVRGVVAGLPLPELPLLLTLARLRRTRLLLAKLLLLPRLAMAAEVGAVVDEVEAQALPPELPQRQTVKSTFKRSTTRLRRLPSDAGTTRMAAG